jgi:hypothetical protein
MVLAIWEIKIVESGNPVYEFIKKIYDPLKVFKPHEHLELVASGLVVEGEYALIKDIWSDKWRS